MNKHVKLFLIAVLIVGVFSFFKKDPLDEVQFSDDLSDVLIPTEVVSDAPRIFDFELCEATGELEIRNGSVVSKLEVIKKTQTECLVQTSFESQAGHYSNECSVPLSAGTIDFTGSNFEEINSYCAINATGTGLLELN